MSIISAFFIMELQCCISEQCFFYTGAAKRRSAKQRHTFGGHDIRTKRNSAHEGTAALQQRYQHQWKSTATRVDLMSMLSKSCAIRTSPQVPSLPSTASCFPLPVPWWPSHAGNRLRGPVPGAMRLRPSAFCEAQALYPSLPRAPKRAMALKRMDNTERHNNNARHPC